MKKMLIFICFCLGNVVVSASAADFVVSEEVEKGTQLYTFQCTREASSAKDYCRELLPAKKLEASIRVFSLKQNIYDTSYIDGCPYSVSYKKVGQVVGDRMEFFYIKTHVSDEPLWACEADEK